MSRKLNLGFTYNVRHVSPDINNQQYLAEAEFDTPETIAGITQALQELGHTVYPVEADEDAYAKFKKLKGRIDLVFNVAEGLRGRDREAQIPAILEMLQIPYTGPGPLGYALGLNKAKAKEVLVARQLNTPYWLTIEQPEDLAKHRIDFFPVIAKPLSEGSSKGICARNLVNDQKQLQIIVNELINQYHQPVLVEEYLAGREFTVAVLGTPPVVLPIVEMTFDELPVGMPKFDHFEAKWVYEDKANKKSPLVCPAQLEPGLEEQIKQLSLAAFAALEMQDWARLDIRLDAAGIPHFIEINCPPGIMPDLKDNSRFPLAARAAGYSFPQMLEQIINSACQRYKL